MPQASDELRAKFPDGTEEAHRVLRDADIVERPPGFLRPLYGATLESLSDRARDAVEYLCDEWDYQWSDTPMSGVKLW